MCGPMAGMMKGVMGGLSAIAGYNAKVEDFNAREVQWQTNYKSALSSGRDEHNQLTMKAIQDEAATGERIHQYNVEGAVKSASAEAAAAGAGVAGGTLETVLRDVQGKAAHNRMIAKLNGDMVAQQIGMEQKGVQAREIGRIASVTRPTAPNPAEAFLGIAGAVLGGIG